MLGLKIYILNTDPFNAIERRLLEDGFPPVLSPQGFAAIFLILWWIFFRSAGKKRLIAVRFKTPCNPE
jgi:hypothetical protein